MFPYLKIESYTDKFYRNTDFKQLLHASYFTNISSSSTATNFSSQSSKIDDEYPIQLGAKIDDEYPIQLGAKTLYQICRFIYYFSSFNMKLLGRNLKWLSF